MAAGGRCFWRLRDALGPGSSTYFLFFQGPLCKMVEIAVHVSSPSVSVFVCVCTRFPYPVIQVRFIKKNPAIILSISISISILSISIPNNKETKFQALLFRPSVCLVRLPLTNFVNNESGLIYITRAYTSWDRSFLPRYRVWFQNILHLVCWHLNLKGKHDMRRS
jgi:hypothetical protein